MRQRLSYANVMSTLAVFAVLGGGAWAAGKIGPRDIKRDAVRSKHVRDRALTARDVARGAFLPSNRVLRGAQSSQPANEGALIFSDRRTGLAVRVSNVGSPRLVNTNDNVDLELNGLATRGDGMGDPGNDFRRIDRTITPGDDVLFFLNTVFPSFVDVLVTRIADKPRSLRLTCAHTGGPRISCIGIG